MVAVLVWTLLILFALAALIRYIEVLQYGPEPGFRTEDHPDWPTYLKGTR